MPKTLRRSNKKAPQYVYFFGGGKADGNGSQKPLLGGKGANLHEMTRIGLPVPPGFTITTELCTYYYDNKKTYPKILTEQVNAALTRLEKVTGKKFGDRQNPLLGLRPLGRARVHARHDGHDSQPRPQR